MKTIICVIMLYLVAVCSAELRTWTAVNGKEVDAEFVSNEKGIVKLKLKSGKIFEVPANKLSKEDNAFISSLAGTDEINDNELTMDQVLKIENQPHQPIIDIPQLITAKLKVGMWESERTIDVHESSLQKAKIINRKSLKRIKHVNGKYVVVQTYDENGNKVFTEVHSYNTNTEKLISVGISATGKLMRMIGTPDLKNRSIQWVKQPSQSDQILQILIICSQDGKSLQIKGSDKVGKEIIASWKGKGQWKSKLPSKETTNEEPVDGTKPKQEGVNAKKVVHRENIFYLKGSETPYTGRIFLLHENGKMSREAYIKEGKQVGTETRWYKNGKKKGEANFKDDKQDGLTMGWHENGKKQAEANFKDGELISEKYWNSKGEPVDTWQEAK